MGISSVVEAVEAVAVSVAALRGLAGGAGDSGGPDSGVSGASGAAELAAGSTAHPVSATPGDGPSGVVDPARDEVGECLDALVVVARLEAATAALKVRLVAACTDAQAALLPPSVTARELAVAQMSTVAELACALTISERAASGLVELSRTLTTTLPLTLAALQGGAVSFQHARILADETTTMDPATAAGFEAHFLDPTTPGAARGIPPGELVPSQFRAKTKYWREHHHTNTIEQRHTRSAADRRLEYTPAPDGMAWLSAYLPATTATSIWDRATTAARAQQNPHEPRTLTQLRADTAATWLLTTGTSTGNAGTGTVTDTGTGTGPARTDVTGTDRAGHAQGTDATGAGLAALGLADGVAGPVPSPRAHVLVTVPVFALMGLTDEPAHLDGYGPIPPSTARKLIAGGAESFHRVLTDPRDGTPLDISRTSYRIPTAMRRFLMLRDGKCRFPGCNNHSLDNETDHTTAWNHGGTTATTNLQQLCRKHHMLKHNTTWTPTGTDTDKGTGTDAEVGTDTAPNTTAGTGAGPDTAATTRKTQQPGWTSPTGRTYRTETQQWQPTTWPPGILNPLQPGRTQPEPGSYPASRAEPDQNPNNEPCQEPAETDEPTWTGAYPEPPDWLLEQSAAWDEFAAAHPELLEEFAAPPDHEVPQDSWHHHRTG